MSHVTPVILAVSVNDKPGTLAVSVTVPRAVAFSAHIHVGTPTMEIEPGSNGVNPWLTAFNFKLATDR
jgi:hypothetical protein